jgi:valyl-tRNA synthetase
MAGDSDSKSQISNPASLPVFHRDILAKIDDLATALAESYADYRFGEIAQRLYEFLWNEFCDKFLEAVKLDLRESATPEARAATLGTFDAVMARFLQLLSPYMPHIAEELSHRMGYLAEDAFLMTQPLPAAPLTTPEIVGDAREQAAAIYESAGKIRNLKAEYNVATRRDVRLVIKSAPEWLAPNLPVLALLCGAGEISLDPAYDAPKGTPASVTPVGEVYLPLEGLIDVEAERTRLTREIEKIRAEVGKSQNKLANPSFVDRAPAAVVEQEKSRLADWQTKLAQLADMLAALG